MKTIATQPLDSADRPTEREGPAAAVQVGAPSFPPSLLRSASPPHLSAESLGNVLSFSRTASPTLSCTSSLFPIHPAASTVASGVRPHQSRLFCPSPLSLSIQKCHPVTFRLPSFRGNEKYCRRQEQSGDVNEGPLGGKRDGDAGEKTEEIPMKEGEYEAIMTSSSYSSSS